MADVFLSYASVDRTRAQHIAAALENHSWTVWWDRKIVAGDAFDRTIERELDAAKCVVVLWSQASVASEWVKNEAAAAVERGTMVPCAIEAVRLPLEFRRKQCADLTDWRGDTKHPGWLMLIDGIASRVSGGPQAAPPPEPTRSAAIPARKKTALWAGGVALAAVAGVGFILLQKQRDTSDAYVASVAAGDSSAAAAQTSDSTGSDAAQPQGAEAQDTAAVQPAAEASTNYPLTCRGGGAFEVRQDAEGHVQIGFAAAPEHAAAGLNPGECSWSDRPLSDKEPHTLCDDTEGARDLVAALARQDETVTAYVHYDPVSACLRVVQIGT